MNIISMHTGHDASVAYFEDFDMKFISKEERLNRIKSFGREIPKLSLSRLKEQADAARCNYLVATREQFPFEFFKNQNLGKKIENFFNRNALGKTRYLTVINEAAKESLNEEEVFDGVYFAKSIGCNNCSFAFTHHHYAHLLPLLYYKKNWNKALFYVADGGGDFSHYLIAYFDGKSIHKIYGGDDKYQKSLEQNKKYKASSLGQMYCYVTEIAGYKRNRHEGKITGLAAFGKPSVYAELKKMYYIDEQGIIGSYFNSYDEVEEFLLKLKQNCSIEDLAASAQRVLEDVIVESILKLKEKYDISNIGLSGGVFSNVKLNQRVSEIEGVKDVFVLPFMGDEGLPVGGALDLLIQKKGFDSFLANRRELGMPYFGEDFGDIKPYVDSSKFEIVEDNRDKIVAKTVELLRDKKICAIFTKGMEYGPRALGARSILIDPSDRSINDSVNKRLSRTEFMPFAPYVRIERVRDVFEVTESNLNAMKYMTITCNVKKEWHDKIPAVVHVDGTARPQTIEREDNPLYYNILHEFEKQTGIPCLVNTSFNTHEEPIINTPQEALKALEDDRVDYLIAQDCIIRRKLEA